MGASPINPIVVLWINPQPISRLRKQDPMTTAHRFSLSSIVLMAICLPALTSTACSVLQRFSFAEPSVGLETVTITGLSLSGGSLRLRLNVHNPNAYDLQGTQFSADVNFEGTHFGTVSRDAAFALPAEADAPIDLDLRFTWAGVGAAARSVISEGAVDYELRGRVLIDTPIDDRWVEIGKTGTARLEDLTRAP